MNLADETKCNDIFFLETKEQCLTRIFSMQCTWSHQVFLNRRIRISLKWQMTSLWLLQTLVATCPHLLISCHLLLKSSQSEALILTQWPIRSLYPNLVTNENPAAACSRLSTILAPCRLFISQTSGPWAWGTLNWKPSENCICLVSGDNMEKLGSGQKIYIVKRGLSLSVCLIWALLTERTFK